MSDTELAVEPAIAANSLAPELEVEKKADPAPAKAPEDPIQKRFDKLTREKYDAQRERDRLSYRLEQLEAKAKTPAVATQRPTLAEHGFDEEKYQQALEDFIEKKAVAKVDEVLSKKEREAEAAEKSKTFEKKQTEFIKSKPDYAEKVLNNDDLKITQTMADAIRESEVGPQVAYYLGENPEKAAAIAQLSITGQAREIGRIEAQLESKPTPPSAQVSKAPPPAPKIEPTESATTKSWNDPSLSVEEFAKRRRQQIAQRK